MKNHFDLHADLCVNFTHDSVKVGKVKLENESTENLQIILLMLL